MAYRKNLDAAYLLATTTPTSGNPLATAADLHPWVLLGEPEQTFVADAEAEFAAAEQGASVSWSTDKFFNNNVYTNSTPYSPAPLFTSAYSGSSTITEGTIATLFDGIDTIFSQKYVSFSSSNGQGRYDCCIDLSGAPLIVTRVRVSLGSGGEVYHPNVYGSNDLLTFTPLYSHEGPVGASPNLILSFENTTSYRYYRINAYYALYWYELELYTSPNTFATNDLVASGPALTFNATTLVVKDTATGTALPYGSSPGVVNVAYRTSGGATAYSTPVDLEVFRGVTTAPDLSAVSYLQIQFQLVGAQTMGYMSIKTYATSGLLTRDGTIVLTGDISADDITLTGDISADSISTVSLSASNVTITSLSGQPNTLLIVDNSGKIVNSSYTIASITGGGDVSSSLLSSISGNLQTQITNNYSTLVSTSGSLYSIIASVSGNSSSVSLSGYNSEVFSISGATYAVPKTSNSTTLDLSWLPTTEQWVSGAPASGGPGIKGQEYWDGTYFYKCVNTNTWVRANFTSVY